MIELRPGVGPAVIASSFQDFSLRWGVDQELRCVSTLTSTALDNAVVKMGGTRSPAAFQASLRDADFVLMGDPWVETHVYLRASLRDGFGPAGMK